MLARPYSRSDLRATSTLAFARRSGDFDRSSGRGGALRLGLGARSHRITFRRALAPGRRPWSIVHLSAARGALLALLERRSEHRRRSLRSRDPNAPSACTARRQLPVADVRLPRPAGPAVERLGPRRCARTPRACNRCLIDGQRAGWPSLARPHARRAALGAGGGTLLALSRKRRLAMSLHAQSTGGPRDAGPCHRPSRSSPALASSRRVSNRSAGDLSHVRDDRARRQRAAPARDRFHCPCS